MKAHPDRRREARYHARFEVEVCFTNWGMFQVVDATDFSSGGMRVQLTEGSEPVIGSAVKIRWETPARQKIEVDGTVRHVTSSRTTRRIEVGFEFTSEMAVPRRWPR
jgi:hypothetical protein